MEGLTPVLVLFIFACFIYRDLVRNHPQFYGAFGCVIVIILASTLRVLVGNDSFTKFVVILSGFLHVAAILLLALSVGGLSAGELAGEARAALDAVRRGDDRPVIVPRTGEVPRSRDELDAGLDAPPPPPKPRPRRRDEDTSIPLD